MLIVSTRVTVPPDRSEYCVVAADWRPIGEAFLSILSSVESKRVMKRSTGEDLGAITMSLGVAVHRNGEGSADLA